MSENKEAFEQLKNAVRESARAGRDYDLTSIEGDLSAEELEELVKIQEHERLKKGVRDEGWEAREPTFVQGDYPAEVLAEFVKIWKVERLKRAAYEAGRQGEEILFTPIEQNRSPEEMATIRRMHQAGESAPPVDSALFESSTYDLGEKIGSGTFARVYKGRNKTLKRPHAIKVLKSTSVKLSNREAQLLAKVRSEFVVQVYHVDRLKPDENAPLLQRLKPELELLGCPPPSQKEEEGRVYIVMEYVRGETLQEHIKSLRPIKEKLIRKWMVQCCEGMKTLERKDIIHRDLKPANLFISEDDDGEASLKIGDFGLAKQASLGSPQQIQSNTETDARVDTEEDPLKNTPRDARSIKEGYIVGSKPYMSPEHWTGNCTIQSDIYSFGATFYHLLTGRPPPPCGLQDQNGLPRVYDPEEPTDPPDKINPELSAEISELIMTCLERDPADRFESFDEIPEKLRKKEEAPGADTLLWGFLKEGRQLLSNGNPESAKMYFSKAIGNYADSAEARCGRGEAYLMEGDIDRAFSDFDRAIKLKSDYHEAYFHRGRAFLKRNRLADPKKKQVKERKSDLHRSIADFNRAIRLKTDYHEVYFHRGLAHLRANNFSKAIKDFDKTISDHPDSPKGYLHRGRALATKLKFSRKKGPHQLDLLGEYDEARTSFHLALAKDPEMQLASFNLGLAWWMDGVLKKAEKCFQEAGEEYSHLIPQKNSPEAIHISLNLQPHQQEDQNSENQNGGPQQPFDLEDRSPGEAHLLEAEILPPFPDSIPTGATTEITADLWALVEGLEDSKTATLQSSDNTLSFEFNNELQPIPFPGSIKAEINGENVSTRFDQSLFLAAIQSVKTKQVKLVFYWPQDASR